MSDNLPPEELVKALRAEQRALSPSGSGKIISRLINPQGPQAAALIERLEARVAELEEADVEDLAQAAYDAGPPEGLGVGLTTPPWHELDEEVRSAAVHFTRNVISSLTKGSPMTDVAEIAKGLSKAQRRAVRAEKVYSAGWTTIKALQGRGLVAIRTCFPDGRGVSLTPLGLAVRSYLSTLTDAEG